jgi:hypothetical protein
MEKRWHCAIFRYTGYSVPHYLLTTPTLAIMNQPARNSVMIPRGAIVQVAADGLDGEGLVGVDWDGQAVLMFTTDLRERCERVEGT